MQQNQLWAQYCAKNPKFAGDGNVTLSAKGLKKFFDQTWEQAHSQGVENGKALARKEQGKSDRNNPFKGFGGFGG